MPCCHLIRLSRFVYPPIARESGTMTMDGSHAVSVKRCEETVLAFARLMGLMTVAPIGPRRVAVGVRQVIENLSTPVCAADVGGAMPDRSCYIPPVRVRCRLPAKSCVVSLLLSNSGCHGGGVDANRSSLSEHLRAVSGLAPEGNLGVPYGCMSVCGHA